MNERKWWGWNIDPLGKKQTLYRVSYGNTRKWKQRCCDIKPQRAKYKRKGERKSGRRPATSVHQHFLTQESQNSLFLFLLLLPPLQRTKKYTIYPALSTQKTRRLSVSQARLNKVVPGATSCSNDHTARWEMYFSWGYTINRRKSVQASGKRVWMLHFEDNKANPLPKNYKYTFKKKTITEIHK